MSHRGDDWVKPHNNGNHLTEDEVEQLRRRYRAGWKPRDAAREIKCSSRVAYKYFGFFRSAGAPQAQEYRPVYIPEPKRAPADRFYRGNFEL